MWGEPAGSNAQRSWINMARLKLTHGRVLGYDGVKLDISSKSSIS